MEIRKPIELTDDETAVNVDGQRKLAAGGQTSVDVMIELIGDNMAAQVVHDLMTAEDKFGMPDHKARAEGAKLYYAYREGKPIERQQIVKVTRTEAPPMEQLAATPAGIEAMVRMLAMVPGGREAMAQAAGGS